MKYTNKEHTKVMVNGMLIPKGHRLWDEYGVDTADVEPYVAPDTAAQDAHQFVISELSGADLQVSFHLDGDTRAVATQAAWRSYRKQLRDYTSTDSEGTILVNGDRPTKPE